MGRKNQKGKEVFILGRLGFFLVNSTEFSALTQDDSNLKLFQEKGDFPANGQVEWPKKKSSKFNYGLLDILFLLRWVSEWMNEPLNKWMNGFWSTIKEKYCWKKRMRDQICSSFCLYSLSFFQSYQLTFFKI